MFLHQIVSKKEQVNFFRIFSDFFRYLKFFSKAFSIDEMMVLMQKAIDFTGTSMQSFTFLYRCKPRIYWDYVYEMGQVLNPYLKDSNGQAACPLNQNIEGFFKYF